MDSIPLRRVWLDDAELSADRSVLHDGRPGPWSVTIVFASFPVTIDILNLDTADFRAETQDGKLVSGRVIGGPIEGASNMPVLSLMGTGRLSGLD